MSANVRYTEHNIGSISNSVIAIRDWKYFVMVKLL